MRRYFPAILFSMFMSISNSASAQNSAINFDEMAVGTEFHYQNLRESRSWKVVYAGVKDGVHVLETYADDGTGNLALTRSENYDAQGRLVGDFRHKGGVYSKYAPFNCQFSQTPECEHDWTYPNSLDKETAQYFTKTSKFTLKRDGQILVVTRKGRAKDYVITYELGDYNMRIKQVSIRKGKERGNKLTKIVKP